MSEILAKHFISGEFNAEKYVKSLSSHCVGAEELRQRRAEIQELADSTSALLKQNVYQNYIQFIETAKEISHLETEMYQLSQLLNEQRSMLNILGINQNTNTIFKDNMEIEYQNSSNLLSKEEESKQKLLQLLDNVEGAASLVETPGRICLYEGSLLELDPLEGTPIKRIHAYLFNDVLMIASWLSNSNKRGPPRYKMQVVYDIQSLAIINVRDLGSVKLAFKLLAFPDTRVFQCATATSKKEWLEKCDQAKKLKNFQDNKILPASDDKLNKLDSSESISQSPTESNITKCKTKNRGDCYKSLPEWILEVTDDLDSYIAQRHFEEAYNLLEKAKTFVKQNHSNFEVNEIEIKIKGRVKYLVDVLTKELDSNTEVKFRKGGGLRSVRRTVRLLLKLDCCAQACQLYLKLCSRTFKTRLRSVKKEGATVPYIKLLSAIAFSNIVEISQEFLKIFSSSTNCTSALIVWCSQELKFFVLHLIKQMFIPQVSLSTLVECITTIRNQCEQLTQIGMDFRYQLDSQLRAPLSKALLDTKEKYIDAIKVRGAEDTWKPSNLQTTQNLHKLLSELEDLGIPLPEYYIQNNYWIPLTNNTLTFSKLYIGLLEDCLSVTTSEIMNVIEEILISVLQAQLQHIQMSLANPKFKQEIKLLQDNFKYIQYVIIPRTLELHRSVTGYQFYKLQTLQENFSYDQVSVSTKPKPAPRTSVTKYSTIEYI